MHKDVQNGYDFVKNTYAIKSPNVERFNNFAMGAEMALRYLNVTTHYAIMINLDYAISWQKQDDGEWELVFRAMNDEPFGGPAKPIRRYQIMKTPEFHKHIPTLEKVFKEVVTRIIEHHLGLETKHSLTVKP